MDLNKIKKEIKKSNFIKSIINSIDGPLLLSVGGSRQAGYNNNESDLDLILFIRYSDNENFVNNFSNISADSSEGKVQILLNNLESIEFFDENSQVDGYFINIMMLHYFKDDDIIIDVDGASNIIKNNKDNIFKFILKVFKTFQKDFIKTFNEIQEGRIRRKKMMYHYISYCILKEKEYDKNIIKKIRKQNKLVIENEKEKSFFLELIDEMKFFYETEIL